MDREPGPTREQRPGVRTEEFGHLVHDGLQDGVQVQRRGQGLRHIVEDGDFLQLPFAFSLRYRRLVHWEGQVPYAGLGKARLARIIA